MTKTKKILQNGVYVGGIVEHWAIQNSENEEETQCVRGRASASQGHVWFLTMYGEEEKMKNLKETAFLALLFTLGNPNPNFSSSSIFFSLASTNLTYILLSLSLCFRCIGFTDWPLTISHNSSSNYNSNINREQRLIDRLQQQRSHSISFSSNNCCMKLLIVCSKGYDFFVFLV